MKEEVPEKLIEEINKKLTPRLVLEKIGYKIESIQETPNAVRCFCPIHKETVFRSLVINKSNGSFKCSYTLCPGFTGGSLLELYRLATNSTLKNAVLFWAQVLDIDTEFFVKEDIVAQLEKEANDYIAEGNFNSAIETYKKIAEILPESEIPFSQLAKLYEKLDDKISAANNYYRAGIIAISHNNLPKAISFLEYACALDPTNITAKEALVEIYLKENQKEKATFWLTQLLEIFNQLGKIEKAIVTLKQLISLEPERIDWHEQLGFLYLKNRTKAPAIIELQYAANEYFKKDNISKAIQLVNQLAILEPENIQWRYWLADLYSRIGQKESAISYYLEVAFSFQEQKNLVEAYQALNKAKELAPDNTEILMHLVDLSLANGNRKEAIDLLHQAGDIFTKKGSIEDAILAYRRITSLKEDDLEARLKLTKLYRLKGEITQAIEEGLELAEHYLSDQKIESAIAIYNELVELAPEQTSLREKLAELYLAQKETNKTIEQYLNLGNFYLEKEDYVSALKYYQKILELDNENIIAHRKLYDIYQKVGETKEALEKLLELANIYFKNGLTKEAIFYLYQALRLDPQNTEALYLLLDHYKNTKRERRIPALYNRLAKIYLARGEPEKATECLRYILQYQPENIKVAKRLVNLLIQIGEVIEARTLIHQIIEIQTHRNQIEDAIESLEELIRIYPDDLSAVNKLISLSEELFKTKPSEFPASSLIERYKQAAQFFYKNELFDEAINYYQKILELNPTDHFAYQSLLDIYRQLGKTEDAVNLCIFLGDTFSETKNIQAAIEIYKEGLQLDSQNKEIRKRLIAALVNTGQLAQAVNHLNILAKQYFESGKLDLALSTYSDLLKIDPKNVEAQVAVAELLYKTGKEEDALSLYKKAAANYAEKHALPEAIKILKRILSLRPEESSLREELAQLYLEIGQKEEALLEYDALASYYRRKKNLNQAKEIYLTILNLAPENLEVRSAIAELYLEESKKAEAVAQYISVADAYLASGNTEEALQVLAKVLKIEPDNQLALEKLAEIYLTINKKEEALEIYYRLASLQCLKKQIAKAISTYQTILTLDKDKEEIYVQLINLAKEAQEIENLKQAVLLFSSKLAKEGRTEESIAVIEENLPNFSDDFEVLKTLASLYVSVKRIKAAIKCYLKIAKKMEQIGKIEEAIDFYNKVLSLEPNQVTALESLIALYKKLNKITENIDLYLKLSKFFGSSGAIFKAIQVIEEAVQFQRNSQLYLELAKLYLQAGLKGKAIHFYQTTLDLIISENMITKELMDELLSLDLPARDINQLFALAEKSQQFNLLAEAAKWLEKILKIDEDNFEARQQLARIYRTLRDFSRAIPHYEFVAQFFMKNGNSDLAMQSYKEILNMDPQNIEARKAYIELYLQSGPEEDMINEYITLGDIYFEKGELEQALSYYDRVLKLDPTNQTVYTRISQLTPKLNKRRRLKL